MSETCPTCGSKVKVVGNVTKHYEPVNPEAEALAEALRELIRKIEYPIRYISDCNGDMIGKPNLYNANQALKNWEEVNGE